MQAIGAPIPPVTVTGARCQEIIVTGDELRRPGRGLAALPVPISTPGFDAAPYLTATLCITRDPDVLAACAVKDRAPTAAIGVEVVEAFVHCAKAFRRGGVWDPKAWPDQSRLASAAC